MTVNRMRLRLLLLAAGVIGAGTAVSLQSSAFGDAAEHTWSPFVLVAGLLLIGAVANQDGIFSAAAQVLGRLPGGDLLLYVASMLLVAVVTVLLNLDTSVAFLTPVLVLVARRRGADVQRLLYGCVFMSNAASLLLPGSNLTNLLILSNQHQTGSVFFAQMLAPWCAAILVTIVVVAVAFRSREAPQAAMDAEQARPSLVSLGAMVVAAALILVLTNPALPVLGVGLALAAARIAQRRVSLSTIREIDVASLSGVFLIALALGTLARVWSFPGHVMANAGDVGSAAIGAVGSILVNNLPAAVLLGSRMPADPRSLLLGLDIGPNLAVTGSLSALIWWSAARTVGARPSALRYSAVGLVLVPLTLAAAILADRVF